MERLEGTGFSWCCEITTHAAVRATTRAGSHTEGANLDNLPAVVTFEQVLACCEMEVKRMRETLSAGMTPCRRKSEQVKESESRSDSN